VAVQDSCGSWDFASAVGTADVPAGLAGGPCDLRTDVAHIGRVYDYVLGGKTNYPADRAVGDQLMAASPLVTRAAAQNRAFIGRATRHIAAEGVRQFLDLGSGIPMSPNLHEIAQAVSPDCRVVYLDNDPIVLAHARALLVSDPRGRTCYLDADLRQPERILCAPDLREALDLTRPVAVSLGAVLHFFPDDQDPYGIVRAFLDALPSGSYLTLTHATNDFIGAEAPKFARAYRSQGIPTAARSRDEVACFFDGLDLVGPGVVPMNLWWPDACTPIGPEAGRLAYAAVGRKR
jgi:hypothetical protein